MVAACAEAAPDETISVSISVLPPVAPATTAAATTTTLPPTTTTVPANPLTRREISEAELLLMTMSAGDLPLPGFQEYRRELVPNDIQAITSLLDAADEGVDVAEFGRVTGARAAFDFPRLPVALRGVLEMHTAVALFATDVGASGYLADLVTDAAKGIGGGRPTDLKTVSMDPFEVDQIGDEAVGFTLAQAEFTADDPFRYETLVAFRVGRVLAIASVLHAEEDDFRLRALELAADLEQQVLGVLRGTIRVPEPPPEPEDLEAYAFRFSQEVDRGVQLTRVDTSGIVDVVADAFSCDFKLAVDNLVDEKRYVAVGDDVWFDVLGDGSPGFTKAEPNTFFVERDIAFCPGWAVPLEDSRLDEVVAGLDPIPTEAAGGRDAFAYSLGQADLEAIGFLPSGSGIRVTRFEVVTDALEPWLLGLELDVTGPTRAFVSTFGEEFEGFDAGQIALRYRVTVDLVNDPELFVEQPG